MNQNIGLTDRIVRILVAIAAAVLGFYISPWFYLITVIGLLTAASGYCGLYSLLGISTVKKAPVAAAKAPVEAAARPAAKASAKKARKKAKKRKKR